MRSTYEAIRRKYSVCLILIISLISVSLGVCVGASVAVALKLTAVEPSYVSAYVSGICTAVITAAALLVPFYPTEKRAARYLDKRLGLNERVGTMVSFAGDGSDIAALQREDTERMLSENGSPLFPRRVWIALAVPALAVALALCAVLVPAKAAEQPDVGTDTEDEAWVLTDWHITAIRALIEEVRESDMESDGISRVVSELEALIVKLGAVQTVTLMKQTVIDTMLKIADVASDLNSFPEFARVAVSSPVASVKAYGEALGTLADPIIESGYHELRAGFKHENMQAELAAFASGLSDVLSMAEISEDDEIRTITEAFCASLNELAVAAAGMSEADATARLKEIFDAAAGSLSSELALQNANLVTASKTNNTLMLIFGIARSELPDDLKYADGAGSGTTGGDYEEKDDEVITDGGKGSGDVIYGSDDAVFDPEKDEHVVYGDILAQYDALKSTELEDRELSEALREFIGKYFDDLYYSEEEN